MRSSCMVGICATSYFFGDNLVTWPRHLGSVVSSREVCAQPKPGCEFWLQKEEGVGYFILFFLILLVNFT